MSAPDERTPLLAENASASSGEQEAVVVVETRTQSYLGELLRILPLYLFIFLVKLISIGPVSTLIAMTRAFACADYLDATRAPPAPLYPGVPPHELCAGRAVELRTSTLLSVLTSAEKLLAAAAMAFVYGPLIQKSKRRPMLLLTVLAATVGILPYLLIPLHYPFGSVYRTPEEHDTTPTLALGSPRFGIVGMVAASVLTGLLGSDQVGVAVCRALIVEFSSPANQSKHLVHAQLAVMASIIVGPASFGWVAERYPTALMPENNRTAFYLSAACCLAMLLLSLFVIPETRSDDAAATAAAKLDPALAPVEHPSLWSTLRLLLPYHGDSRIPRLGFITAMCACGTIGSNTYITYLSYREWSPALISYLLSFIGLTRVLFLLAAYPPAASVAAACVRKPDSLKGLSEAKCNELEHAATVKNDPLSSEEEEDGAADAGGRPTSAYSLHGLRDWEHDLPTLLLLRRELKHWRYRIDTLLLRTSLGFETAGWLVGVVSIQLLSLPLVYTFILVTAFGTAAVPLVQSLAVAAAEDIRESAPLGERDAEAYNVDNAVAVCSLMESISFGFVPLLYSGVYFFTLESCPALTFVVSIGFFVLASIASATL